jgi:hypothetical protein
MANVTANPAMEYALGYTNAEHERLTRQAAPAGMFSGYVDSFHRSTVVA